MVNTSSRLRTAISQRGVRWFILAVCTITIGALLTVASWLLMMAGIQPPLVQKSFHMKLGEICVIEFTSSDEALSITDDGKLYKWDLVKLTHKEIGDIKEGVKYLRSTDQKVLLLTTSGKIISIDLKSVFLKTEFTIPETVRRIMSIDDDMKYMSSSDNVEGVAIYKIENAKTHFLNKYNIDVYPRFGLFMNGTYIMDNHYKLGAWRIDLSTGKLHRIGSLDRESVTCALLTNGAVVERLVF